MNTLWRDSRIYVFALLAWSLLYLGGAVIIRGMKITMQSEIKQTIREMVRPEALK